MKKVCLADMVDAAALGKLPDLPFPDQDAEALVGQQGCPEQSPFTAEEEGALAELATNLWWARKRLVGGGGVAAELKWYLRRVDAALACLERLNVEVTDHTGQSYDTGMAVKVAGSQPKQGAKERVVAETLKPTVSLKGKVIQQGEVTVDEPVEGSGQQEEQSGQTDD